MKKCIDSGLTEGFEALRFAIRMLDDNASNYSFDLGLVAATDEKTQYESFKIADQGKDLFHIRENGTMRQCTLIHFMIHEAK